MKPCKKLIYITVLIVISGFAVGIYMYNKPQENLLNKKADFVLTPSDLQKEFMTDEAAANQKYIGKTIELFAKPTALNIEADKVVSLIFETDITSSVICTFRERIDAGQIDTIKPVRIRGELSGYLMDVLLNNCVVVR